ncbi:hypothetical protein NW768_011925 [Fusarium equiseti]|uniref:Heterokaryon incompatibility domain-containing protein n=1 Tax=Fusarium equiseti TaxID=61235 RepID=A0ABQ8QWQ4_FUSEQ|nr:hypothetical protein NW768_011925 [Fusarium equiseti]
MAENIEEMKSGVTLQRLPAAYVDAITLTRQLGVRYIWIDALCIIQDSQADWEKECSKMAETYTNAYVTIAAASSSSVTSHFLKPWLETPPQAPHYNSQVFKTAVTGNNGKGLVSVKARLMQATGAHWQWQDTQNDQQPLVEPLTQRGWTLQEKILSTRLLSLSASEMVWTCKERIICECGSRLNHQREFGGTPLSQISRRSEAFNFWHKVVENYAKRKLTRSEDKLPAISAIAAIVQKKIGSDYIAGLWADNIELDLLWRRPASTAVQLASSCYIAPSFSWASITGEIDYLCFRNGKWPYEKAAKVLEILFSRPGLKSLDMNSANLIDAVNLSADTDEAASSISEQKRDSSLGRRYRTNFTTFTANHHGVFEARKRKGSHNVAHSSKRARVESTRKSVHYDAVYQNNRAAKKHIIVRSPTANSKQSGEYHIIRCDIHNISFDKNPVHNAAKHLRAQHEVADADHDTVIEHFGVEVIGCDDEKLDQNNKAAQEAFKKGQNGADDCIIVREDLPPVESPQTTKFKKLSLPAQRIKRRKATRSQLRKGKQEDYDYQLELVPGKVYAIYWNETKSWFPALLLPLHDLASIGIHESFLNMGLVRPTPLCYEYDSSSQKFTWANGYEDGGPQCLERHYPFIFFEEEEKKFPEECQKAWIPLYDIMPWNEDEARRIDHSERALEYLRENAAESQREIPDSIDEGKSLRTGALIYSDLECDSVSESGSNESELSSLVSESSAGQQLAVEAEVANPDTLNEPEFPQQPTEASNGIGVHQQYETRPESQTEELPDDLEMEDASSDTQETHIPQIDEPAATTAAMAETAEQEGIARNKDIRPERYQVETRDAPAEDDDEMDLSSPEATSEFNEDTKNRPLETTSETREVTEPPEEMSEVADDSMELDVHMKETDEEDAANEEPEQNADRTIVEPQDDPVEDVSARETGKDEAEDLSKKPDQNIQSEVDHSAKFGLGGSSRGPSCKPDERPRRRYGTDEDCLKTKGLADEKPANKELPKLGSTPKELASAEAAAPSKGASSAEKPSKSDLKVSASLNKPQQGSLSTAELENLLQEGESLYDQLSHSESISQQDTNTPPSSTSSDDSSLMMAHNPFDGMMVESNSVEIETSRSHVRVGEDGGRPSSQPLAKEGSSQHPPLYADVGERASLHSRSVSLSSETQRLSLDEASQRGPAPSNTVQHSSYAEMGRGASTPSRPSTRDGRVSQQHSPISSTAQRAFTPAKPFTAINQSLVRPSPYANTGQRASTSSRPSTRDRETNHQHSPYSEMGQPASTSVRSTTEPPPRNSSGPGASSHSHPSLRGGEGVQVQSPKRREGLTGAHHEARLVSKSPPAQMPLPGAAVRDRPQVQSGSPLQQVTASPLRAPCEVSQPSTMRPPSQAADGLRQSADTPSISSGGLRHPHAQYISSPPAVNMALSNPGPAFSQCRETTASSIHEPTITNAQPTPASRAISNAATTSQPPYASATLGRPSVNGHIVREGLSSRQPALQSPRLPSIPQNAPAPPVTESPRLSYASTSRSSSFSQGYKVPVTQPLPSPRVLAGETSPALDFRIPASPHQPVRELPRPYTTRGQSWSHVPLSPQQTSVRLPPPSTLAHGHPSPPISASPRLQAMEVPRPGSAIHGSRPPTSPRQYAMSLSRPGSAVHGARAPSAASSPQLASASTTSPRPSTANSIRGPPLNSMSPRQRTSSVAQMEPSRSLISESRRSSAHGPLPPPRHQGSNYVPASSAPEYTRAPSSTAKHAYTHPQINTRNHHDHSYSYRSGSQNRDLTPRSHRPAYQVPVQQGNPPPRLDSLLTLVSPPVALKIQEKTGMGHDLQPEDCLNYDNKYQCLFCRIGIAERAIFIQHLDRFCPYTQPDPNKPKQAKQVRR